MSEFETWWSESGYSSYCTDPTIKSLAQKAWQEGHVEGYSEGYDDAREDIYDENS